MGVYGQAELTLSVVVQRPHARPVHLLDKVVNAIKRHRSERYYE